MSENIYPHIVPSAPRLEINASQEFRLSEIRKLKELLKNDIDLRIKCYKKYNKISNILSGLNTGFTTIGIGLGISGISLLSTIISVPVVIILESIALGFGATGIGIGLGVKRMNKKLEKHERLCTLAISKLNSINDIISKALADNNISDSEFNIIIKEYDKYLEMKREIRNSLESNITDHADSKKDLLMKIQELQSNVKSR